MKTFLSLLFSSALLNIAHAQITFSNFDFQVKKNANQKGTEIIYSDTSLSLKFQLTQKSVRLHDNILTVDSQLILLSPLRVDGSLKPTNTFTLAEQKQFLTDYSQYELDYFANEAKFEVINPNSQWVEVGSRHWYIWYFRLGKIPMKADKKVEIQLFASTLLEGKVLTINTPIMEGDDFGKAGLLVNQMMETLTITKRK